MDIRGRISKVLPLRSGVSQRTGNTWQALPFVVDFFVNENDHYPDSVLVETFDVNLFPKILPWSEVKCNISHRTREYNGRIYNELRLYRCEVLTPGIPAEQPPQAPQVPRQEEQPTETPSIQLDPMPF